MKFVDVMLAAGVALAVSLAVFAKPAAAGPTAGGASAKPSVTDSLSCSACHTTAGWKMKGATGAEGGFDHAATGFPLTGQHTDVACVTCHAPGRVVKRDCVSCHQDNHGGRLARACDQCHSAVGWRATKPIDIHRFTRLPLTGMHVLADCTQCHTRAAEHQWSGTPSDCFSCHERDYRRPGTRPVHQGSATTAPFPRDCSQCHRSTSWVPAIFAAPATGAAPAALKGEAPPPGHDLKFPITFGVHRLASCSDCHASLAVPRNVRCIGCHAHDPARTASQHKSPVPTIGAACVSCHLGGARR